VVVKADDVIARFLQERLTVSVSVLLRGMNITV
jgi:hypothetical protein